MDILKTSLRNPWVRLWIVASAGLLIYWTVVEIEPLARRYNAITSSEPYVFVENYVRSPVDLYFKEYKGSYSEIAVDVAVGLPSRVHCSIPEAAIACMQKERPPLVDFEVHREPFPLLGSKRAVVTSVAVRKNIEELCAMTVLWFAPVADALSKSAPVKQCVGSVAASILEGQRADIAEAQNYVVQSIGKQVLLFLAAVAALAVGLGAAAWIVQGFRTPN